MEIKFKQLLFTVQKRTIRCNLEIANFWIEDYERLPSSMLAIRSIIVVFVVFCWILLKSFDYGWNIKKKSRTSTVFYSRMLKSHNSVAHDLTHVQLLIQKLKVLLNSLFMNIYNKVSI